MKSVQLGSGCLMRSGTGRIEEAVSRHQALKTPKHSSDYSGIGRHPGEVGRTGSMEPLGQSSEVWEGRKTKQRELG